RGRALSFRAAVIGCGRIGSGFADDPGLAGGVYTHAEAYVCSGATDLVAVCDLDPQIAADCASRGEGAASFTAFREDFGRSKPEIVSLCTPDGTHFEIARQALESSSVRAILCEKPLATSNEQVEEFVRLARENGKTIAVAYVRRYAHNMNALRAILRNGDLGEIRAISGWYG